MTALGRGLQRAQIAARIRLGGAVGEQDALFGDARQPELLLLRRGADGDRIAAQESGQHRRRDAQIDARHLFANAVDVERAAAEAAVLFGNEQKLDAQLVGAAHVADDLERALVALVQVDQLLVGQPFLGEVPQRFQTEFQCLLGDHRRCLPLPERSLLSRTLLGQFRQELQNVVHDAHVRHPEDRRFGILVDGDDERIALDARPGAGTSR